MNAARQLTARTILSKPVTRLATTTSASARALPIIAARSHSHSSKSSNKEWVFWLPDHPNSLDKRLAARQQHFDEIQPSVKDQSAVMGGATMAAHAAPGEAGNMNGSFMIIRADTEEEAWQWIKNDVYTKNGIWDLGSTKVWAFRSAFRTPVS